MTGVVVSDRQAASGVLPCNDFIIETCALTKRYGGVLATDRVDLRIPRGEIYGIIGPNGAGKSTLVGLLGGAIKASSGRIIYDGEDITALPAPERARRGIGRTYQIPRPFLDMTVAENLQVPLFSADAFVSASQARDEVDVILARTGLADATGDWPEWNFHKYLIDRQGKQVKSIAASTNPATPEVVSTIEQWLKTP